MNSKCILFMVSLLVNLHVFAPPSCSPSNLNIPGMNIQFGGVPQNNDLASTMKAISETRAKIQASKAAQAKSQNPGLLDKAGDTLMTAVINSVVSLSVTALAGYVWSDKDEYGDRAKLLQLEILTVQLERAKNDSMLLERFKELEAKYLLCRSRKGDCTQIAEEFLTIGGMSAADIINRTS